MIISLDDDDEHDPYLPPAEIMPPAPRGGTAIPGDDIGDWIGFNGRIYEMDEADQKRLRPVWVRDPRAVRNEQFKAERRAQRQRGSMIISLDDDDEHDPYLPPAEIMPPAPRGGTAIPGDDIGDWIVMPPEGAGDGNPGR